ncbi:MAG: DUF192 domain-containing protein [Chloroflexota bacterium]
MRWVTIHNLTHSGIAPVQAHYCDSFFCQLRGLTFRRVLPPDQGLLLVQGRDSRLDSAIHMLGVYFDLAVVWINQDEEVVDVKLARRWRPAYVPKRPARYVLELAAERLNDFHIGDRVKIETLQNP